MARQGPERGEERDGRGCAGRRRGRRGDGRNLNCRHAEGARRRRARRDDSTTDLRRARREGCRGVLPDISHVRWQGRAARRATGGGAAGGRRARVPALPDPRRAVDTEGRPEDQRCIARPPICRVGDGAPAGEPGYPRCCGASPPPWHTCIAGTWPMATSARAR